MWGNFLEPTKLSHFRKVEVATNHGRATGADDGGQCRHSRPPTVRLHGQMLPVLVYLFWSRQLEDAYMMKYIIDASEAGNSKFCHSRPCIWPYMAFNRVNWCTPTMVKSPPNVTSVNVFWIEQLEDAYVIKYITPDASEAVHGGQFRHG